VRKAGKLESFPDIKTHSLQKKRAEKKKYLPQERVQVKT
jgi:hypothetical protein